MMIESVYSMKKKQLIFTNTIINFFIIFTAMPVNSQTLRQIGLTRQSARTPNITVTSSSVSINSAGALVQAVAGLEKQKIEIDNPGNPKTVLEVYTEASVDEITLFDPSTYVEASANTSLKTKQNDSSLPFICAASGPGNVPNTAGTITDGTQTLNIGPGEAPSIFTATVETPPTTVGSRTNVANPLVATVLGSGTDYARSPYLSSGTGGSATTGPQQIVSPNLNVSVQGVVLHQSPSVLTSCGNT